MADPGNAARRGHERSIRPSSYHEREKTPLILSLHRLCDHHVLKLTHLDQPLGGNDHPCRLRPPHPTNSR